LPLSARTRALIEDQRAEWCELDRRISAFDNEFAEVARSDERARLTTGGKPKLLGISKRGNVYLPKMLIHGARAALPTLSKGETPLGRWLSGLLARAHLNTVVVALAAKLARIVWAVLRSGKRFEMTAAMAS
jgi:transposase